MEIDGFRMDYVQSAQARLGQYAILLVSLFIFSFALDFRGTVGGGFLQFTMAGLNSLAFILLVLHFGMRLPVRGGAAFIFWGWLLYLLFGSIGAIVNGVPAGQFVRIIYPVILFLEGFLVAWWVGRRSTGAGLVHAMIWTAVISLVFTLWWGFYFSGRGTERIRYEILSPLIPFLLCVAGYDLAFAQRNRMVALLLVTATLGVIALSVTRGMILPIGMIVGVVVMAAIWNFLRGREKIPRPLNRIAVWGAVLAVVGLGIGLVIEPDILQRWVLRSLSESSDVTFWTRVAAISGQWDQLIANPSAWLFGEGFGHSYYWPDIYAPLVTPDVFPSVFFAPKWYPGEFMWVTPLFYSGFIAGSVAIIILLFGVVKAFGILSRLLWYQTWKAPEYRPLWLAVLGYFAFIGLSFTANPFIVRQAPLFMGLCMGLFIALDGGTRRRLDT